MTVITAGAAQRPGEDRLSLVKRNDAIFGQIVPAVAGANPGGIIVVATNPVDVLAYRTWRRSGLPAERVIGSGTILDTARFRALLAAHFDVDPRSVHAYIAGEHGDSEVPIWSSASIGGMHLRDYCLANDIPYDTAAFEAIFTDTRDAAYRIIEQKGATYYAVAAGLQRLTEAILRDQNTVLPVSTLVHGYQGIDDVYLSLPAIVGGAGIQRTLRLALTDEEAAGLRHSAGGAPGNARLARPDLTARPAQRRGAPRGQAAAAANSIVPPSSSVRLSTPASTAQPEALASATRYRSPSDPSGHIAMVIGPAEIVIDPSAEAV